MRRMNGGRGSTPRASLVANVAATLEFNFSAHICAFEDVANSKEVDMKEKQRVRRSIVRTEIVARFTSVVSLLVVAAFFTAGHRVWSFV